MNARLTLQLSALTLLACTPLASQQGPVGTAEFVTRVSLPDSLKAKVPLGDTIEIRVAVMGDGHRYAADISTGPTMTMFPNAHLRVIVNIERDSVRLSAIVPAELRMLTGGVPGYQVSVPLSMIDSLARSARHLLDSVSHKMVDSIKSTTRTVSLRNRGSTSVVAGVRCEEWQTISGVDTADVCLVPTPASIVAVKTYFKQLFGIDALMAQIPALAAMTKDAFGGRDMTSIRMVNAKYRVRVELLRVSGERPGDAEFDVPNNLLLVPLPSMTGHTGAGAPSQ